ncbi:MAG: hypothetical protein HY898_12215 [Deltaproteobacteria bacterium]|nr:hypothetical protein [Deltaproteobacteria bacterium]
MAVLGTVAIGSLHACALLDPVPETSDEDAGPDAAPPPVCTATQANCDELTSNGCEVDLASDPLHCGTCDTSCMGGGCNDSQCGPLPETVVTGLLSPMRLVADGDTFFVVCATGVDDVAQVQFGAIVRASADGTEPRALATDQLAPDGLAVDDIWAYWTNAGSGSIARIPKDGGTPYTIVSGQHAPRAIAADGDHVYWTSSVDRVLMRSARDGTDVTTLVKSQDAVLGVALNTSSILYGTSTAVYQLPKSGGEPTLLASEQPNVIAVYAEEEAAFWIAQGRTGIVGDGSVRGATLSSAQTVDVATRLNGPMSVVADSAAVYWTNLADGTVMKAPRGGGKATMLASQQSQPWGIAIGPDGVYWTSFEGGEIRKLVSR